jgi:hypothetical protein
MRTAGLPETKPRFRNAIGQVYIRCEYGQTFSVHAGFNMAETFLKNLFITCNVRLLLFCTMANKCTIISQNITLLRISTLTCHPQEARDQCLAKLHKYFICRCW